jgi:hypothetical protein
LSRVRRIAKRSVTKSTEKISVAFGDLQDIVRTVWKYCRIRYQPEIGQGKSKKWGNRDLVEKTLLILSSCWDF